MEKKKQLDIIDGQFLKANYPHSMSQIPKAKMSLYKNNSLLIDQAIYFLLRLEQDKPVTGLVGSINKEGKLIIINAELHPDKEPIPVVKNQQIGGLQFKVSSTRFVHFLIDHFKLAEMERPIYFPLMEKYEPGILIMEFPVEKKEAEKGLYKPKRKKEDAKN